MMPLPKLIRELAKLRNAYRSLAWDAENADTEAKCRCEAALLDEAIRALWRVRDAAAELRRLVNGEPETR